MRILGVDYGSVKIGLAVSDSLGIIAQPLETIRITSAREGANKIALKCTELGIEQIVIGLPVHMSGEEGESAVNARALGKLLEEKTGMPVGFIDERMSTCAAERALLEADVSRDKRREKIDSIAASIILQSYLDKGSAV